MFLRVIRRIFAIDKYPFLPYVTKEFRAAELGLPLLCLLARHAISPIGFPYLIELVKKRNGRFYRVRNLRTGIGIKVHLSQLMNGMPGVTFRAGLLAGARRSGTARNTR